MESISQDVKYAGFWIRFLAGLIDSIILTFAFILFLGIYGGLAVLFHFYGLHPQQNGKLIVILFTIYTIGTTILYYLYFALLESSSWQATLGMKACGLKITDSDFKRISFWRALGREICTILSSFILYIGYIMIAFTRRKQGLHDMICDTYVVKA